MKRRQKNYAVAIFAVLLCAAVIWGVNKQQYGNKAREIEQICNAYIEEIKTVDLDDFQFEIKARLVENQDFETIKTIDIDRPNAEIFLSSIALKNGVFIESLPPDGGSSNVFCEIVLRSEKVGYTVGMRPGGAEIFISHMKNGTMQGYIQMDCSADRAATDYFMERLNIPPVTQ